MGIAAWGKTGGARGAVPRKYSGAVGRTGALVILARARFTPAFPSAIRMKIVSPDRVSLSADEARSLAVDALGGLGYDAADAAIIAEHVVDAALCGYEYSGLGKIFNIPDHPQWRKPRGPVRVLRETPVSALMEGGNQVGMLAMWHATTKAIEIARASGIALVALGNSWMSGRSAHFVEAITRAGLVGIHTASPPPTVAPPGGTRPALGTNPLTVGLPGTGAPVLLDMGTSAFMASDLLYRERMGETLPEGVAIDSAGRPTRDPAAARAGALLAFGGHKGFGLALVIQGLGLLSAAHDEWLRSTGYLVVAFRPDLLLSPGRYEQLVDDLVAQVKATPRQPGVDEIRLPSERAFRERARALREGIEIERRVYDGLVAMARSRPG